MKKEGHRECVVNGKKLFIPFRDNSLEGDLWKMDQIELKRFLCANFIKIR
jgi:hypothetical protein